MKRVQLEWSALSVDRLIWIVLSLEWGMMMISGLNLGKFYGAGLFEFGIDPVYWLFFFSGIPKRIHEVNGIGIGLSVLAGLSLIYGSINPHKRRNAGLALLLLMVHYLMITAHMGHRNFQTGSFLILIPFLFKQPAQKFAWEGLRHWALLFYLSAGLYKLINYSEIPNGYFSALLRKQWLLYGIEHSTDFRLRWMYWLIGQPEFSNLVFWMGCFLELFCIVGLFTRRMDFWIIFGLFTLHAGIWLTMDIGFLGQIAFLIVVMYPPNNQDQRESFN
jgi:hypothetical protein